MGGPALMLLFARLLSLFIHDARPAVGLRVTFRILIPASLFSYEQRSSGMRTVAIDEDPRYLMAAGYTGQASVLVFAYNTTHLAYKRDVYSLAVDGFIAIPLDTGVTFRKLDAQYSLVARPAFAALLSDGSLWTWDMPASGLPQPTRSATDVVNFYFEDTTGSSGSRYLFPYGSSAGHLIVLKANGDVLRGGVKVEGLPTDRRVCSVLMHVEYPGGVQDNYAPCRCIFDGVIVCICVSRS